MNFRKFNGDDLFDGQALLGPEQVLITREDGRIEAILPAADAGENVEKLRGIISPGFINCHCHLELSHMRGLIPEKTGMVGFLLAVMQQRSNTAAAPTEETINQAIEAAEEAMLHGGIVAVGDICNTPATVLQKSAGRLYYHNFIETMGFVEKSAPDRFAQSLKVFQAFADAYTVPIETCSLVPHAPYSVSPRLFGMIAGFPGNQLLTIHNQESEAENEFSQTGQGDFLRLYQAMGLDVSFFTGTGKRSLESSLTHFYRHQSLILVHNVATTEEDLRFARHWQGERPATGNEMYFCLCPNANLYITGRLPDLPLFLRHDLPIVIGTDSLASNHQLSILEELKTLQKHFPGLSPATLLGWATRNGAAALQLDKVLGTFHPGKQPGVLLIGGVENGQIGEDATVLRLL